MIQLWEIFVPCKSNEGKPFRTRHHREWDKRVQRVSGGLSIFAKIKGKWVDKSDQKLYTESMIPVRIACSREEIDKIIDITIKHYNQIAVMAYRVSDEVIIKYKGE
jgi:hypothetical protein